MARPARPHQHGCSAEDGEGRLRARVAGNWSSRSVMRSVSRRQVEAVAIPKTRRISGATAISVAQLRQKRQTVASTSCC